MANPMAVKELRKAVEQIPITYEDAIVYFYTEGKTFDCHIVPIKSFHILPEEVDGEKKIVFTEYVYKEEPLIVHNVMYYKGKNYLKQPQTSCSECSFFGADICKIANNGNIDIPCDNNIWKSFDKIRLTDELACSRRDIGDIYITHRTSKSIVRFTHIVKSEKIYNGCIEYNGAMLMPIAFDLTTAEELQEHLKLKGDNQ